MTDSELHQLLVERAEMLRKFVGRRIPRRMERIVSVEDVLQEIWTTAFRSISTFAAHSSSSFDRWLITIARTRLLNAIRYANQPLRTVGRVSDRFNRSGSYLALLDRFADPGRTPSSENACNEAVQAIRLALSGLPDEYRKVITMHHIEGRSHAEVATVMNKTKAAVNGLLHRGLIQLKDRMGCAAHFYSDTADGMNPSTLKQKS